MARYIDAEKIPYYLHKGWDIFIADKSDVDKLPTADVVEVKHGEWILTRKSNGVKVHKCSVCGRLIYTINENLEESFPYCHCGAKMDRGKAE